LKKKLITKIAFLLALTTATPSLFAQSVFDGKHSLILLNTKDPSDLLKLRETIEKSGGHVVHLFPPNMLQGYLTAKSDSILRKSKLVKLITDKEYKENLKNFSADEQLALQTWNAQFLKIVVTRDGDVKGENDKGTKKAPDLENTNNKFVLRGQKNFYLTSEYLMGSVSIGIVFVESNGKLDKKTESWTKEDQEDVLTQIHKGLDWWAETGGYKASLSWTYEIHHTTTQYEPINRTKDESVLWVKESMDQLGYSDGEDYTLNREFANDIRDKYQTDWAFVIYVVPATNDDDGYFAKQTGIAWAYLGGPYMIISNKCNGWGYSQVWKVVAHESGHIFNALDEYKGSSSSNDKSGRLNVVNGNHEVGGVKKEQCLMKSNELKLCEFTLGQIGWVDADTDGTYDSDYLNISKKFNKDQIKRESSTVASKSNLTEKRSTKFEESTLFAEDFRQKNGWFEDANNYVKDGVYHMYDPEYGNSTWLEKPYSDFDASVKTKWIDGSSVSGYGLMFRIFGPNDSYIFFINGDGQYCVGLYLYGNWKYLHDWARSSAIKQNGENVLRVRVVGSNFSFFVNDQPVCQAADSTISKGNIGFAILPETHITFDDLVIRKP